MAEEDKLLNFYSSALSDRMKKLTQPLEECFHLNGFFYSLSTSDGEGYQITNQPDVGYDYFSKKLYKTNPFICHPDNYQDGQFLITSDYYQQTSFQSYYRSIEAIKNSFGFENYLCLFKKDKNSVHVFMFSSNKKNQPLNGLFLNNHHALNRFGDHFLKEWSCYSQKMDQYMINLGQLMGPHYYSVKTPLYPRKTSTKTENFMKKIGLLGDFANVEFSAREVDCIEHLLKGKSASQIGDAIGIQKRTTEHYIENIKDKLDCSSKNEMIELLTELKGFHLL